MQRNTDVVPDIFRKAAVKDGWVLLAMTLTPGERFRPARLVDGYELFVYAAEMRSALAAARETLVRARQR